MKNMLAVVELLGEDNTQKLKDKITDLLIKQVEIDMEEKYKYEYICAFEGMYEKVAKEIKEEVKEKLREFHMKKLEEQLKNLE